MTLIVAIPRTTGSTKAESFFPGRNVKVDPAFRQFLEGSGPTFDTGHTRTYRVIPLLKGMKPRSAAERWYGIEAQEVCAMMRFLESEEGSNLLEIPSGEEEVNVVLGYFPNEQFIEMEIIVEHELEQHEGQDRPVDEIHLHARPSRNKPSKHPAWVFTR